MTDEQIQALQAANNTQAQSYEQLDSEQLYKVIGGDWGNNYGHVIEQSENTPTVSVELIGQGVIIDADRAALLAVPFFGA